MLPIAVLPTNTMRRAQKAVQLLTVHQQVADAAQRAQQQRTDLTAAKQQQQSRIITGLDARLAAAHASVDAQSQRLQGCAHSVDALLQEYSVRLLCREGGPVATPDEWARLDHVHAHLMQIEAQLPDLAQPVCAADLFSSDFVSDRSFLTRAAGTRPAEEQQARLGAHPPGCAPLCLRAHPDVARAYACTEREL